MGHITLRTNDAEIAVVESWQGKNPKLHKRCVITISLLALKFQIR